MSNQIFTEATTSVAFCLTLSKRSCHALLLLSDPDKTELERTWILAVDGLRPLERKGLVFWHHDEQGRANGFGGMTEAGRLVAKLLREAGMTLDNTVTVSTNRRREQLAERA